MRKSLLIAGVALLLLPLAVQAQAADDEWFQNKPIADIRFEGLRSVSPSELQGIIDPFIGREFTDAVFLDLQRRLYALDLFERIVPEALPADDERSQVILQFQVTERPLVDDIRFSGNRNIRRGQLLDVILLNRGDVITQAKIRVDEQAIRNLYQERGYPDVEVRGSTEEVPDSPDRVVVFTINEGARVTVREILFSGNSYASAGTLRGVMETKQQSLFNRGIFQEALLEQDRSAIERYYRERGFVDARVLDIDREVERDEEAERTYLTLTVFIEEGLQYTFGGMEFRGNSIFDDEQLQQRVRMSPGDVLNIARLDADYQRVADLYYENGYIFNSITRDSVRDEATNTISYVVNIVERSRARIENIEIRGNEKTIDHVIYREVPLEVGDIFSATKIRQGMQGLANLQYFSNIVPETPQGSEEGLMDLIINVEEGSTADIRFGVAFGGSADFPVSAQIAWQDRNFLGRGQTIGAELVASPVNQRLSVNFLERWLTGRRWSGGFNFAVDRNIRRNILRDEDSRGVPDPFDTEEDFLDAGGTVSNIPEEWLMEYTEWNISIGANTGYRWLTPVGRVGANTSLRTGIEYLTYDPDEFRPLDRNIRRNLDQWLFVNRWGMSLSLDDRDVAFNPTSGYYVSQGVSFTGGFLFGTRHFIRTDSRAEQFYTLWDWRVSDNWSWKGVLGLHTSLSMIFPQFWIAEDQRNAENYVRGEEYLVARTGTTDLLYIDGMFTARGWPRELDGKALWNNWVELRMPLAEQVIWLDNFFEATALYEERSDIGNLGIENMRFSMGSGLRFVIPQFPIRIYLAKRFLIDSSGNIDWQTGNLFNRDNREGRGLDFVFSIGMELF
ncbi:MAG: outer membrane protein assembly factor BamA [Spirochaetaceae bacterium]|nr:MAG: outer membrane protein assembly factor BamA [Spirochaetaceae bacterium]